MKTSEICIRSVSKWSFAGIALILFTFASSLSADENDLSELQGDLYER